MKKSENKIIVIGVGNVGRQDDALGWLFLDYIEAEKIPGIDIEYRYQLQVEDSDMIRNYDRVFFVDACRSEVENGFFVKPCKPSNDHSVSTHALKPETVIYLTNDLYDHKPEAFIIGIKGYEWNLEMGVTDQAYRNYIKAIDYFLDHLNAFTNLKSNCSKELMISD